MVLTCKLSTEYEFKTGSQSTLGKLWRYDIKALNTALVLFYKVTQSSFCILGVIRAEVLRGNERGRLNELAQGRYAMC